MAMTTRRKGRGGAPLLLLLLLAISFLLLATHLNLCSASADPAEDEDLEFLEQAEAEAVTKSEQGRDNGIDEEEEEEEEDAGPPEGYSPTGYGSFEEPPQVEDKDVVVLTASNFTDLVSKRKHVLVEFYAPWCGHCQALAPEYAAAATQVKEEMTPEDDVVLAKVDASDETDLSHKYSIQGFPTLLFFIHGDPKPYNGARTKDAIVAWIRKKIGPAIHDLETVDEAKTILESEPKLVLGFFHSLTDSESQELAAASKIEDDLLFYRTTNPDVAKLFGLDSTAKRPSLIMLKKEEEKSTRYDAGFTKAAILDFITGNKLPLVNYLTRETAQDIFESSIKMQFLLFASANDSQKIMPTYQEVAKLFKGKILFVSVELDNEDIGVPVANYFGITGAGPMILAYTGNEDGKKFIYEDEITFDAIKRFGEEFLQDKLKPFLKSDTIPESNDGDVKIVVGKNFDEIVLDESKDVLLEIYASWCGHCQALEPIYNKLAKYLRGIDSLVIAKMDGTTNEHPRAKADGFPTLLFFPAGKKSFDPISVETERTVVAFYKFIKQHASIPFKLQKPTTKSEHVDLESKVKGASSDLKDEL